jgi:OOP family OmpA-OmpF porin
MTPLLRRSRLPLFGLATLTALSAALYSSSASAQTGFIANRFDPSEKGSDWFENESLDYRSDWRPAFGVIADYSKDPVVLRNPDGSNSGSLVSDQLYFHLGVSMALWNRLRLGASLPLELAETGNTVTLNTGSYNAPSGAAVGDLRLGADLRLYGEYQSPFSLAIGAQVYLPTGQTDHFTGDGETRFVPRLMIAGDLDVFAYAVRFGYEVRPRDSDYVGHQFGDELSMGAAVGLRFLDKSLLVGPELSSYTLVSNAFQASSSPTEILMGAHYRIEDIQIGAGIGSSFNSGDSLGAPSFRMLLGIEWHPSIPAPPPPADRDEDGIPDQFDACPDTPGPYEEQHRINGCPPDADKDGIPDEVDACPNVPGVKTDDPKTNGCPPPPPDRDHDGILDSVDACPDVAGVPTNDPKTNGCPLPPPNPDRDKDGILNEVDACPDDAGPANADPKKNGCPLARDENGQIKISEQVKFAENSAQILKDSDTVLNAVVDILTAHPEIEKLKVEGYTDSKGSAVYNKNLSKQRAASVKAWLVKHKVDGKRLESDGFGAERPIDDNATEAGRKNNRRVEFHIGEKGAAPPAAAAPAPAAAKKK